MLYHDRIGTIGRNPSLYEVFQPLSEAVALGSPLRGLPTEGSLFGGNGD